MKEEPNMYAIIPSKIMRDKRIKLGARLLYGEITSLSSLKGYCWASNEYFAELYDCSKRTITDWITELKMCEYISVEMIYKQDTKNIDKRIIKLLCYHERIVVATMEENLYRVRKENSIGYGENSLHPMEENLQDNTIIEYSNITTNTVADFSKNEETFFKKELEELKEYFSESSENINLSLETENKAIVENLQDFKNQSKEVEVFSKETSKAVAKKSKEIFFSETNYFSDAELFSQDLLKRFPKYEKYDLQHYHTSAVNWGQGNPIAKYKKADWILTVKCWIDMDIAKNVAILKMQIKPLSSQKINTMGDLIDQEQRVNEFLIMQERQKQANGTNGTYTHSYELIC